MRRYIVSMFATLDGFVAGPGDDLTALPFDQTFNDHNLERLQTAGTLVNGTLGYRDFLTYWPSIADDPAQDEVEREISRRNNAIDKVVISDSLTPDDLGTWRDTTRIVSRRDAIAEIGRLKDGDDEEGDILTFGSATTWNPFLAAGLVDELHVMVGAGLIGDGAPIVDGASGVRLQLLDAHRRPGSDNVVLRYAPRT